MLHFEDTFTVWNVYGKDYVLDIGKTNNGKDFANVSITSSSKDKKTGKYENDWKGQIRFYGNAFEKIKSFGLVEKDRIKIKGTMQNIGVDGKMSKYPNYTGWEVEKVDIKKAEELPKAPEVVGELELLDVDTDSLPF